MELLLALSDEMVSFMGRSDIQYTNFATSKLIGVTFISRSEKRHIFLPPDN